MICTMLSYGNNTYFDLPQNHILEVSLIGTGGGYGESIVIHLGNQNWIIIDSCIDPKSKECLPLKYLQNKGVDIESDVKLIVCTHWHDDHILGISKLLSSCKSSIFCMSHTTDPKKFLQFVGLDHNKSKFNASASSTTEIMECFKIVRNRNNTIKGASQDKCLLSISESGLQAEIYALSPSDFIINEFANEISTLISDYGTSNRKIVIQSPNDKSVALWICVNNHNVLLGSDLEVSIDRRKGWFAILDNSQYLKFKKASLFKIPHHGSINGYDKSIWDTFLTSTVTAKLTPWNKGNKILPDISMLKTFLQHTKELYITSNYNSSGSPKKREHDINKAITRLNPTIKEIKYKLGIIRCQLDISNQSSNWNTELFGEAIKITDDIF